MDTFIVNTTSTTPEGSTHEQAKEFHEKELFAPLRALAANSGGQLEVVNEMKLIGVAVVEASDEMVAMLKKAGYQVHVNGRVQAF